jgi:hypothetical protein
MKKQLWVICSVVIVSLLVSSSVWAEFIASRYYQDNVGIKFKYKGGGLSKGLDHIIDTWKAKLSGTVELGTYSGSDNIYGDLSTPNYYNEKICALTFVDETGSFEACFDRISFIITDYSKNDKRHPEKASITGTGLFYDGTHLIEGNISIICDNVTIQEDPNGNAVRINSGLCNMNGGYSSYDSNLIFSPGYTFTAIFNANYMLPE